MTEDMIIQDYTVKGELIKALHRFSYGRLTLKQAIAAAEKFAPVYERESERNEMLAHKGVGWFAKEVLKVV